MRGVLAQKLRLLGLAILATGLSAAIASAQTNFLDPTPLAPEKDNRIIQRPQARETAATSSPPASAAPRGGSAAGRYAPLRDGGKDTGCMITLDGSARGPNGTNKAQLAPACRDQGLVVFDPVGWQVERGRLAITARKGHKAYFDRQPDGIWLRDPKEGRMLALRPI
jgi:hypothetical protein